MLRVLQPEPRATTTAKSIAPESAIPRAKILLAEDNIVNQQVAVGLLTRRGHEVTAAATGREALDAIDRERFDVVLMDLQMPEMGGFEATAVIRAREQQTGGHLRIVAMTAHAMSGDRERCLAAGMDGYLAKPVDRHQLFAAVEQNGGVPSETAAAPVSRDGVLERLGGDEELLDEVVRLFLEDCPAQLARLKDAVDARDAVRVRSTAHALKGAAGSLAASALYERAKQIEGLAAGGDIDGAIAAWRPLSAEAAALMETLKQWVSVHEE
jgi:CheY-like chemotaxis protein